MQNVDVNATISALKEQRNFHADQCAMWQGIAAAVGIELDALKAKVAADAEAAKNSTA